MAPEKATAGRPATPDRGGAVRRKLGDEALALADRVLDEARDHAPYELVDAARRLEARIAPVDLGEEIAQERDFGEVVDREQPGAQPVVDVMGIVGDVVGQRRRLRLAAGEGRELQILLGGVVEDRERHAGSGVARRRAAVGPEQRAVVLDQALERLPGEVQPVERGVAPLEPGHEAKRLGVVVEAAERRHAVGERVLAGVAEGRVAEVVRQRQRLGEILVEAERAGERAGDLADLDRMGEPGAVVVALVEDEDLGLVLEAAEGARMDDAVAVALELAAGRRGRLAVQPTPALPRVAGIRRPPTLAGPLQGPSPIAATRRRTYL